MLSEYYRSQASLPEEKYAVDNRLSEAVIACLRDPICLNIPNIYCKDSPAECKNCSQVLCARCVAMIVKSDSKCPNCREFLQVRKINRNLKRIASNLKMHCHSALNGCPVILPLEELILHENKCQYESVNCPNNCGRKVLKKSMIQHVQDECPKELIFCSFMTCSVRLPREEMRAHEANEHRKRATKVNEMKTHGQCRETPHVFGKGDGNMLSRKNEISKSSKSSGHVFDPLTSSDVISKNNEKDFQFVICSSQKNELARKEEDFIRAGSWAK